MNEGARAPAGLLARSATHARGGHARLLGLAVLAGSLLFATALPAAFSLRLAGTAGTLLEQLGGRTIYRAGYEINGTPGRLTVVGFSDELERVAPDVRRVLGMPAAPRGAGLARTIRDGQETTLLLLPGGDARGSLAWLMERRAPAAGAAADAPPPRPRDLPLAPSAEVLFTAANTRSHVLLVVAEMAGAAPTAHAAQADQLLSRGWVACQSDARSELAVFARDGQTCLVYTAPTETDARTRLTLVCRGSGAP